MNEVVKYNNNFNNISLRNFNANELDILMAICSRMKEKGEEEIVFHFDKLKKLIKYSDNTPATFIKDLESTYDKLISIKFKVGDERCFIKFVLFTRYSINADEKIVNIAVNKEFAWILNELNVTFTAFELKEFISLKSSYAKEFYRRMKQFKSTGKWNISLEGFKRIMDVPVNYRMCDIDVWVLKPIQKELGDKFKLKVKKIYSKKSRGRPSVSGFEFTFSKEKYQAEETSKMKNRKEIKTPADFFIHRKVRIMDGVTGMFNTLTIKSINEQKNGMVVVKIQNVDDFYEQEFAFNSMEHFENWFRKYVI